LHAIHKNQAVSVHLLLESGADPNATAGHGPTPLIMAAGYGYANIVEDLLAHGANAQLADNTGFGPLDAAVGGVADIDRFTVGNCQGATVKVLLAHAPHAKLRDATAARLARFSGCDEVLGLLARQ
ncbi:MAG: ankyrin repeat domain-containing protein, partial [Bryobacteraceae bacterium]